MKFIESPFEEIRGLARVNSGHSHNDVNNGVALAEAMKELLKQKRLALISAAEGGPVLVSFSSDGTPLRAKARVTAKVGGTSVRRSGSQTSEYLVQLAMYRTITMSGDVMSCAYLQEPEPLSKGKAAV